MWRHTKIVATIGPATESVEGILELVAAGMDVARLNGSHGNLAWHATAIDRIRRCAPHIPVLLDIPGRKIRTTGLEREPEFRAGDLIVLTTEVGASSRDRVPVNYPYLHEQLSSGDTVFADDGTLRFTVVAINGHDIVCRANVDGRLRSRKGINVPGVVLKTKPITDRDREMLAFVRQHTVDYVGVSFVESAEHVAAVRDALGPGGPRIVSKIENKIGMMNMAEIIEATDAVMIDRGDLSVETSPETVALFQKRILKTALNQAKPAIVATEMLHSMVENAQPTKAEISDITNAVLDGCSATMLSGETAVGRHPAEAVATMRRIAEQASAYMHFADHDQAPEPNAEGTTVPHAMEDAIALICRNLPITKVVAVTVSGYAARVVASRLLAQRILAVSNDPVAARSFNIYPGTEGIFVDIPFSRTSTDHIPKCIEHLWRTGKVTREDLILITAVGYPRSGNRMNLIQTHYMGDLIETMNWDAP